MSQTEKYCCRCGREGHLSKDCPWPLFTHPTEFKKAA